MGEHEKLGSSVLSLDRDDRLPGGQNARLESGIRRVKQKSRPGVTVHVGHAVGKSLHGQKAAGTSRAGVAGLLTSENQREGQEVRAFHCRILPLSAKPVTDSTVPSSQSQLMKLMRPSLCT